MCFWFLSFITFFLGLVSAFQYRGADFSSLLLIESDAGKQFTVSSSDDASSPFERILHQNGVNLARFRVWVSGTYDLAYGLELAKRARAVGMDLFVDLYFSDTWTDAGHQSIPSDWPTDLDSLVSQVYNYTYTVVEAFESQGTHINITSLGNEINDGPLWPVGRISVQGPSAASQLLHAAALAVRRASPSTKILTHLANAYDIDDISYFYSVIFNSSETDEGLGGLLTLSEVDIFGFSHYPFYGTQATFENLNHSLTYIVSKYDKEVMIAETDFPVECDTTATPLSEPAIPVGVEGQMKWVQELGRVLDGVSNALGFVYFEGGWIYNPAVGSPCADNLLVTSDGVVRESITLFSQA